MAGILLSLFLSLCPIGGRVVLCVGNGSHFCTPVLYEHNSFLGFVL